jgi:hypothetical protein
MTAIELSTRLSSDFEAIRAAHAEATKAMSRTDKDVAEIYHEIEFAKFNARDGYFLAKRLQEALRRRRETKDEFSAMNALLSYINNTDDKFQKARRHITVKSSSDA